MISARESTPSPLRSIRANASTKRGSSVADVASARAADDDSPQLGRRTMLPRTTACTRPADALSSEKEARTCAPRKTAWL
eukprot:5701696-Prymnesium_polylepis.1